MSIPRSVIRFRRGEVEYTSSVDRANYTIEELTRAALRDVGKYLCRKENTEAMKLPGLKKSKRVRGRNSAYQYWVRKKEGNLQVGIKANTWYGVGQETGQFNISNNKGRKLKSLTKTMKKLGILRSTAYDNIAEIIRIESQYLSALEDEAEALSRIDESEYQGGAEDD